MATLPIAKQGYQGVLSEDAVILIVIFGQSNPIGTDSYATDAPNRVWDVDIHRCTVWDQYKRHTYLTQSFTDVDGAYGNYAGERSTFRPLTSGYGRSSAFYPWIPGAHVFATDGFGMEAQLGFRAAKHYRRPVIIIKCGQGNTGVFHEAGSYPDWSVESLTSNGGGPEVNSMLELLKTYYYGAGLWSILNDLSILRANIHLAGVVSMMGAYDANGATKHLTYQASLEAAILNLRTQINPGTPTDVPWVVMRSEPYFLPDGSFTNGHTSIAEIRAAQEALVAAGTNMRLGNCDECIRQTADQGEHFLGQGQITLGNEAASQLFQLTPMASPQGEVDPT